MNNWSEERYEREKRTFIGARTARAPLWSQFTLIFMATWGAAWLCSWLLLRVAAPAHDWARALPARYAVAFLFAYGCFFLAVRVWIEIARQQPEHQLGASQFDNTLYPDDSEGCLIITVLIVAGFVAGGLFLAIGGAPMLLEAAFEAAFAGVVVARPLKGDLVIGDWKRRLLANTWKSALGAFLALIALAAFLQSKAPQATTFAQAVSALRNGDGAARPH
jgi:hypothetical protein